MKLKHIPIVLSLLGTAVLSLAAQTTSTDPSPAPATTPAPTAPSVTTPPTASGDTTAPATGDASAPADHPSSYTVASGDSCWTIARKFGVSVKALEKINGLSKNDVKHLKPGQVLKIPPLPTPKPTTSTSSTETSPVASTEEGSSTTSSAPTTPEIVTSLPKPKRKKSTGTATTAQSTIEKPSTVTPSTATAQSTSSITSPESPVLGDYYHPAAPHAKPVPPATTVTQQPITSTNSTLFSNRQMADDSIGAFSQPVAPIIPKSKGFFSFLHHDDTEEQSGWAARFHEVAEQLASHHISYGQSWRPPGEPRSWVMDCSNTSRYIYKMTTNLDLPRTASDQYYYLHLQNKAWDVPSDANNNPDVSYLREHLKPGDLLFWENTYRPERQPPITHVMVFLGQDSQGRWLMAGSQSGHDGEHRHSGPDIYNFDPLAPSGGYTTWMGFVHHKGRFTAFGRPLAADPSKLASN